MNSHFVVVDQSQIWEDAQKMRANALRAFFAWFAGH